MLVRFQLLIIGFLLITNIKGQQPLQSCSYYLPLSTKYNPDSNEVYIDVKIIDSLNQVKVFLVNNSHQNFMLLGYNNVIGFKEEVKNKAGKWVTINRNYNTFPTCGMPSPLREYFLPASSYTWNVIKERDWNSGIYETEVRYSCQIKDSILYSVPLPVRMDIELFLPPRSRIDYLTQNDRMREVSAEKRAKLLYLKAVHHRVYGFLDESLEILDSLMIDYPNFETAYILYGSIYGAKINTIDNISDYDRFILINKAINEWRKIPNTSTKYKDTKEKIDLYSNYLPTKEAWETIENKDCEFINGQYFCTSVHLPSKKVEIQFMNK